MTISRLRRTSVHRCGMIDWHRRQTEPMQCLSVSVSVSQMMMRIDLEQCLKDSPSYRTQLRLNSEQINLLEERYEQIFRMCNALLSNGKVLLQDFQFVQSSIDLFSFDIDTENF